MELARRSESDAEHFRTRKKKDGYFRFLDSIFLFYGVVVWFGSLAGFFFIL